jgi:predicted  nucleic acid-binding Zn-ribbon protein
MADEILQAIESLKTELSERLATLEQRFAKFEIRFDAMDRRLQAFELRFDAMDTRLLHDFQSVNSGFRRLNGKTEVIAAIEAELQTRSQTPRRAHRKTPRRQLTLASAIWLRPTRFHPAAERATQPG